MELAAFVLGGIGIFLIGIHYAGSHLQKITGGSFQNLITKASGNPVGMFASGTTLGFMTQSGKAAAFILSDFVQAGMMQVDRRRRSCSGRMLAAASSCSHQWSA